MRRYAFEPVIVREVQHRVDEVSAQPVAPPAHAADHFAARHDHAVVRGRVAPAGQRSGERERRVVG
ncbi:hypothetical protein [Streptomyces rimosus]